MALQFNWLFSPEETECAMHEKYADAVMALMGIVGDMLDQLLSLSDFSTEIYGKMTDELQNTAALFNHKVYPFFHGLQILSVSGYSNGN